MGGGERHSCLPNSFWHLSNPSGESIRHPGASLDNTTLSIYLSKTCDIDTLLCTRYNISKISGQLQLLVKKVLSLMKGSSYENIVKRMAIHQMYLSSSKKWVECLNGCLSGFLIFPFPRLQW